MPELPQEDDDRRRSPRLSCSGEARIICLPSDGTILSGKLRNLSLGGICVDTAQPIDLGARTEVLVRANASSFRATGLVKAMRDRSRTSMEFVHMSPGGKAMLADLVEHLARIQTILTKLRYKRSATDTESFRELVGARVGAALLGDRSFSIRKAQPQTSEDSDPDLASLDGREPIVEPVPLVIEVDLFG